MALKEVPQEIYYNLKVSELKGINTQKSTLLSKLNIETVKDLIEHYPRMYEDRRETKTISMLLPGDTVTVI